MPRCFTPLLLGLLLILPSARAGDGKNPGPSDLLDQAIWWPGDFGQICGATEVDGAFDAPPIPGYGTLVMPEYFLSSAMVESLQSQKAGISGEVVKRLKAFSWRNLPKAPPISPSVVALAKSRMSHLLPDREGPGPWQPPNGLVLSGAMLRIIESVGIVEALPELLRLEDELNQWNETAIAARWKAKRSRSGAPSEVPAVVLPVIESGGRLRWTGNNDEWARLNREPAVRESIREAWQAWERQLFVSIFFQREMLGVCLGLLEKQGYLPLQQSTVGRITALGRRREGLALMAELGIRSEADLSGKSAGNGLIWDKSLGVPRESSATTPIPWNSKIREEARRLVQGFLKGEPIAGITDGAALLEESIDKPGSWNQMCALPPPIPAGVPMPAGTTLASRHFHLGDETTIRLQACRDLVIPVLVDRLRGMSLEVPSVKAAEAEESFSSERSGQSSRKFGPLLLQVVECLNAVEGLPDLLRLEQQLSDIIARAGADPNALLPDLVIDSPVAWDFSNPEDPSPKAISIRKRATALLICKIYQRELLGLVKTLLEREDYAPIKSSAFHKAQLEEGRKQLLKEVAEIKSEDDIPYNLGKQITWDAEAKKARAEDGAVMPVQLPYSNAIREEIRAIADHFLKNVPPEKRKAGDGMILSWLEND